MPGIILAHDRFFDEQVALHHEWRRGSVISMRTRSLKTSFATSCDRTRANSSAVRNFFFGDSCYYDDLHDAAQKAEAAVGVATAYHEKSAPIPRTLHYVSSAHSALSWYDNLHTGSPTVSALLMRPVLSLLQTLPLKIFCYLLVDLPLHSIRLTSHLALQSAQNQAVSPRLEHLLKGANAALKNIDGIDPAATVYVKKWRANPEFNNYEIHSQHAPGRKVQPYWRSPFEWLRHYDYTPGQFLF
ncbi:unnamed protein product [Amoebophrya sp. A120]|nr:unnamed protein product [Amoebophrya sp. A120]|eukprot:GSA120T00005813001.1